MSNYNKITALYSRLSVGDEDRDGGESNSMGAVYPFWKGNNRTGQPRRGKNHPCPAPLRRLYQPQALSGYGRA